MAVAAPALAASHIVQAARRHLSAVASQCCGTLYGNRASKCLWRGWQPISVAHHDHDLQCHSYLVTSPRAPGLLSHSVVAPHRRTHHDGARPSAVCQVVPGPWAARACLGQHARHIFSSSDRPPADRGCCPGAPKPDAYFIVSRTTCRANLGACWTGWPATHRAHSRPRHESNTTCSSCGCAGARHLPLIAAVQ